MQKISALLGNSSPSPKPYFAHHRGCQPVQQAAGRENATPPAFLASFPGAFGKVKGSRIEKAFTGPRVALMTGGQFL